jgi:DNA-binding transcriptional MerR regulator
MEKSADAFRTISEVAAELDVPQHVLRFWETKFAQVKPLKRGGGRRYYRPQDIELLRAIKQLLYGEGFTIKGVQRMLKDRGARAVASAPSGGSPIATALALPPVEDEDNGAADAAHSRASDVDVAAQRREETAVEAEAPESYRVEPRPFSRAGVFLGAEDVEKLRQILDDLERCAEILAAARKG